ncbi:diguanylate cyclase [Natroniella sulfidigena]|uniref:sensor domain-containing diguanylate cyclase n=1 Tax=Natroniella sulfidigena TaxID=723921 RepID=UPI00200AD5A6|nr:diguanylate cyclase [Natroniella sulfidigena]MCK8818049.1 diguanylate cyclase [Natroniella sulfidigena]
MSLYGELFLELIIYIAITYLIIQSDIFSEILIGNNIELKDKLYLNLVLGLISLGALIIFGEYALGLYIILSGRLLGFPYGIIAGVIAAVYRVNFNFNIYPWGLESLLLGIISDSYHLSKLKNIDYYWRDLIISSGLAFTLILADVGFKNTILVFIHYFIIFWIVLTIISNYRSKAVRIKSQERRLKDFKRAYNSLKGLNLINEKMASNFSLDETYETLVEIGCEQLEIESGGLLLIEDGVEYFEVKVLAGLEYDYFKKMRYLTEKGCLKRILRAKKSYIIKDLTKSELGECFSLTDDKFKSMLVSPVFIDEEVKGIMFFLEEEANYFNANDLLAIRTIVDQAPLLIKKAGVFERMERNVASLSTLQRTSNTINSTLDLEEVLTLTVDMIMGTMGVSMVCLFLFDQETGQLKLASSTGIPDNNEQEDLVFAIKTLAKEVIKQKQPIIQDNISQYLEDEFNLFNIMSVIGIPLAIRGDYIGVITALQTGFKREFKETDKKFLTTLANQVAISIENAKMYEQMEKVARKDGLTKLYNHSYFQKVLKKEVDKVKRYQRDLSLLMLDIDNFKLFNDTYGHQAGDEVLKELAQVLVENTREPDLVARYGGEEFVIILPETDRQGAVELGVRLNKSVREMTVDYQNEKLNVTVSIGVANYQDGQQAEELINAADNALYQAKEAGRDQTCVAN